MIHSASAWALRVIPLLAGLISLTSAAPAQTATVSYRLDDVWVNTSITYPHLPPQQMTGRFEWTYTIGDFENGSGLFTELSIPYYGSNFSTLITTIDLSSIEIVEPGNWHGYGCDITLHLLTDLDPNLPSVIDTTRSQFHVENGVNYQGNVLSGSIVPEFPLGMSIGGTCPTVQILVNRATPGGQVALIYALGLGGVTIPSGYPCAGTQLGLNGTATLGTTLTADGAGNAAYVTTVPPGACGKVYLQALDLTTCGLSPALLLP